MTKTINFKHFNSAEAAETNRLLDYYEDRQNSYVDRMLTKKRPDWDLRGFNVQTRNIVKSIVDKSSLLFNKPPSLTVVPTGATKGIQDNTFNRVMKGCDWFEFYQNVDVYTRLLKTTIVLQQKYIKGDRTTIGGIYRYDDSKGDALMLRMLTQGNSVARTDVTGRRITELAYLTSPFSNLEPWTYRYISGDIIADYEVAAGKEKLIESSPNPESIVTASAFYDVRQPRAGFWFNTPEDILSFQDNLNLFLCDIQYATAHQMQKTLFLDSKIVDTQTAAPAPTGPARSDEQWTPPRKDEKKTIGGLGSIVYLEKGMTGNTPMVEFKGPTTDLKALYDILSSQVRDIAADWDVNLRAENDAVANSGFQVICDQMDNLALREKRAQSFQAGLRRFYEITQRLYPEMTEGMLQVEFAAPTLPVNRLEQEQVYQYEMMNNTITPIDVFIARGMTEEDAMKKLLRDIEIRKLIAAGTVQPVATPDPTNASQNGGNPRKPENNV